MSIEALNWALNTAPVSSSTDAFVLVALANHAGPDGRDAFPSIARIRTYTRLSERAVRMALRRLEEGGLIVREGTAVRDAKIARADQRPTAYRLLLDGGQQMPPVARTGGISRPNGGHVVPERGAPRAPEPSFNQSQPRGTTPEGVPRPAWFADAVAAARTERTSVDG